MKGKLSITGSQQLETIDGPPIDFSFKNLRTLQQYSESLSTNQEHQVEIDEKAQKTVPNMPRPIDNKEQKEVFESKLQIIRTIETNDHRYQEQKHQKTTGNKQVAEKKIKKQILPQTTSLFLRYNKLTSLEGLDKFVLNAFPNIQNLMWIDLSHNRFVALPETFSYPSLKTLYLHANFIYSFKEIEKLRGTPLRTLTIYANPLEQIDEFRIIIGALLPELKKIDTTLLTKRERERAQVLMKSIKKLPTVKNPRKPPVESDAEEDD